MASAHPRRVLWLLAAATAIPLAVLGWIGLRTLDQGRQLDDARCHFRRMTRTILTFAARWPGTTMPSTRWTSEAGRILHQLEVDGLADSTIVFFYTDHGMGLPRGNQRCERSETR